MYAYKLFLKRQYSHTGFILKKFNIEGFPSNKFLWIAKDEHIAYIYFGEFTENLRNFCLRNFFT